MTTRRPLTQEQSEWLASELDVWRAAALVSEDHAAAILCLYETPLDRHARRRSWLLATLVSLAMLLFGAAALLLVSFNWHSMPAALKLAVIFGSVIGAHSLGFYLRYRAGAPRLGEAMFFLGCLLYGAGIWLVAQVFHMSAHYPDGFFWWAIGVLPFAILLDSLALHALAVALLASWCGTEIISFRHIGAWIFGFRGWAIPNLCLLAPILALPGLLLAYRRPSQWRVALYVPLLAWWTILQPLAWGGAVNLFYFVGAVGALLLVVAESHRVGSPLAIPYRVYGVLLFAGVLLPLSYWEFNENAVQEMGMASTAATTAVILALAVGLFGAAEFLRYHYLERGEKALSTWMDDVRRRQWLPLSMVVMMMALALWSLIASGHLAKPNGAALPPTLIANAAMIALAIWLMWVGLREDRAQPFAAGVVYFLLWTVLRYIDLFGQLGGMLGASLMFFLCGCGLLGVVALWRNRKQVQYV
jgi:uncharacterized membrane protein